MKKQLLFALTLGSLTSISAFVGTHDVTNFFRPADASVRLPFLDSRKWHLGSRFEYGQRNSGRNICDKRVNVLQIHDDVQSALAMIENPLPEVDERLTTPDGGNIRLFLQTTPRDGVRGTQCMTGEFKGWDWTFFGAHTFRFDSIPGSFSISAHLPLSHKEISCVSITDRTNTDRTQATAALDYPVKTLVTDELKEHVKTWGCLDLSSWSKTGLGDLVLLLEWRGIFPQNKENLKEVELDARLGLSCPTGESKNEDKAFSMPMGNDGAWGMPIGLSLGLNFLHHVKVGIDADFLALFDEKRVRRLKTTALQTEFLLLNKGCALKEYGLTWQFHLYLQAYHFFDGLSASVAYDYVKHDNDRLTPKTNAFDFNIVNETTNSLKEWQVHNVLFKINYDRFHCNLAKTQFELFYKLPVVAKNVIDCHTFGAQAAINF